MPVVQMVSQRALGHWRLLTAMVVGVLLSSALMACVFLYSDAIRDLGLEHSLETKQPIDLDVKVVSSTSSTTENEHRIRKNTTDEIIGGNGGDVVDQLIHYGRSATFYLAPTSSTVAPTEQDRPRAHFQFVDELDQHVKVSAGTAPATRARLDSGALVVEAWIGKATADRLNVTVGQEFNLFPHWRQDLPPVRLVISGIVEPNDAKERFWFGKDDRFEMATTSWPTYPLFISEETYIKQLAVYMSDMDGSYETYAFVDIARINSTNARSVEDRFKAMDLALRSRVADTYFESKLSATLTEFREKLFFTKLPLFALMLQIVGIALFYLVMVSTMVVDREIGEIALLKSRGASTRQIMSVFAIEGFGIGTFATILGPLVATGGISLLGFTPPFENLSDGGLLPVRLTLQSFVLAGLGALLAFAALMWPAYRACRFSITNYKQQISRPAAQSAFLKYYLDLVFIVAGAFAFYQLRQHGSLATTDVFGGLSADPILLATPSLFMLMIALVFLRLFPLALRVAAWLSRNIPGPTISLGLTRMVRNPVQHSRLILLLILTTAVGMFAAGFRATLEQGYDDRAGYQAGAKARIGDVRAPFGANNEVFRSTIEGVTGSGDVSIALRQEGYYSITRLRSENVVILGVELDRFVDIAFWRDDFADKSLATLMKEVTPDPGARPVPQGVEVPRSARYLGLWAQNPLAANAATFGIRTVDDAGIYMEYRFVPAGPAGADRWQFFTTDLTRPATFRTNYVPTGARRVDSFFIRNQGVQPNVPENITVAIDELQLWEAATLPTDAARNGFGGGPATVESFDDVSRYEAISGSISEGNAGAFNRTDDSGGKVGAGIRLAFVRGRGGPPLAGIRLARGATSLPVVISQGFLDSTKKKVGDEFIVYINRQYIVVKAVGSFKLFPGFDPNEKRSLFVTDVKSAQEALSRVPSLADAAYVNEAWLGDRGKGAITQASLKAAGVAAERVLDRQVVFASQSSDPLIAASWEGILFLSFGAVLLLSTLGFVTYSVLSAESRSLEFALLRTMGFSSKQVFGVVSFEQCFVILAGVLAGTLLGFPLGRLMIGYLGITENGADPLPPLLSKVSWQAVVTVYAMLAIVVVTTVAALVALYSRLAVGRALRMGEL
jgi:ABC-type antimicrobial peptide transport system permease subunit